MMSLQRLVGRRVPSVGSQEHVVALGQASVLVAMHVIIMTLVAKCAPVPAIRTHTVVLFVAQVPMNNLASLLLRRITYNHLCDAPC